MLIAVGAVLAINRLLNVMLPIPNIAAWVLAWAGTLRKALVAVKAVPATAALRETNVLAANAAVVAVAAELAERGAKQKPVDMAAALQDPTALNL
jgi:hypothetical protein